MLTHTKSVAGEQFLPLDRRAKAGLVEGWDATVGNPHRTNIYNFELFELLLLLKLDKQFPVEQFEAAVSQSTVPSPPSYLGSPHRDPSESRSRSQGGSAQSNMI